MSVGSTLLELQEIDLTLIRDKEQLQNLPEIAELARRRKLYIKLKGDVTKYFAQCKDVEIDLQELDSREQALHDGIEKARREVDMDDYRQVQQLEITLSDFAKKLDRVEFERTEAHQKLSTIQADEATLKQNLKKIEDAIVALTKQARTHAVDIQSAIDKNERKRTQLFESLDPALGNAYKDASKRFGHLAVEKLEGNVPSICRMTLQSSSMSDLKHANEVTECPYCHRLMVILPEE